MKEQYIRLRESEQPPSPADMERLLQFLREACAKYDQAVTINPSYTFALNSYGLGARPPFLSISFFSHLTRACSVGHASKVD